jgi:type I restriction enzyme M protein
MILLAVLLKENPMPDNNSSAITQKVWSMCGVLYDDGVSYGDYLEQLTYLIFLKMADEYSKPPYKRNLGIPEKFNWEKLYPLSGAELENHYKKTLEALAKLGGILGEIFTGAQNKLSEAAKLKRIVNMIGEVNWVSMSADVKGDIYEGLLEKNAEDTKSGAGQYFTPRPLIRAMVACLKPEPEKTIVDPACGTGGFFLAAYDYLTNPENYKLDRKQREYLKYKTFYGWEIVPNTFRLCLMNLFLHNIGDLDGKVPVIRNDALLSAPKETFDYVLTNPPFGKKSSMTFTNDEGEQEKEDLVYNRQDFWATTSNKQLNFVQHIHSILKSDGKAAVVVPDNVLFEGGAGEIVRKKLLETTDLHTILRLPTGVFYKQGVKANVIFFDNKSASPDPWTKEVWVYDFRTNIHFTLKQNPLRFEDLQDFIKCYNPDNRHKRKETWSDKKPEGRFRRFTYKEILERDKTSLDIFWLKDKSLADLDSLPDPDVLAAEIMENLETALDNFKALVTNLDS